MDVISDSHRGDAGAPSGTYWRRPHTRFGGRSSLIWSSEQLAKIRPTARDVSGMTSIGGILTGKRKPHLRSAHAAPDGFSVCDRSRESLDTLMASAKPPLYVSRPADSVMAAIRERFTLIREPLDVSLPVGVAIRAVGIGRRDCHADGPPRPAIGAPLVSNCGQLCRRLQQHRCRRRTATGDCRPLHRMCSRMPRRI